jgi:hypothetical protein
MLKINFFLKIFLIKYWKNLIVNFINKKFLNKKKNIILKEVFNV